MASVVRRGLTGITRVSTSPGTSGLWSVRPCTVRALSVTSHRCAKSRTSIEDDEENAERSKPIKFSTSKGSHRTWRVECSMGSTHQRPWWRVLPFSILGISFFLWCLLRKESDIDQALEKQLYEHIPGLLTTEEGEPEDEPPTEALKKKHADKDLK